MVIIIWMLAETVKNRLHQCSEFMITEKLSQAVSLTWHIFCITGMYSGSRELQQKSISV